MRKKCLIWCLVLLFICNVSLESMQVYASSTREQLEETQDEYKNSQKKLNETQDDISELYGQKAELETALDDLNDKLSTAAEILEELDKCITEKKEQIDATWGQVESLATQVDEIEALADEQYELVKAQIKYAYESGDTMYLLLLSSSASYADYINKTSYLQMFTKFQQDSLASLKETSEALQNKRTEYEKSLIELEEEKAELDEYEQKVSEQYQEIQEIVEKTAAKVNQYKDQIAEAESRVRIYETQIANQENDISRLEQKLKEEKELTSQAAGSEWRDVSVVTTSESDLKLLANIIYCEAGNEPYVGKVAVGAVVMNRVLSSVFPNTITGVIYQKKQFTPAYSGGLALALSRNSADEECYKAAEAALNGVNNIGDCLYFRTPTSKVSPKYTIGGHIFY